MSHKPTHVYIYGLTDEITETILINHFHKHGLAISCRKLINDRTVAVIECSDWSTVRKILDSPYVRLYGKTLSITDTYYHSVSSRPTSNRNEDDINDKNKPLPTVAVSGILIPPPGNSIQTTSNDTEALLASSSGSGWSSPPRTIITHSSSMDDLSTSTSQTPLTTTSVHQTDTINSFKTQETTDIKPIRLIPSNSNLSFADRFLKEVDQIKEEYKLKFDKDRKYIEQEINLLISEEQQTFDKFNRYLKDHRRRIEKRHSYNDTDNNHKRKHSI